MKLFRRAKALLTILLMVTLVAGLAACGGTGGESDTDAPLLTLNPIPVSTIVPTRVLSGTVEPGAQLEISRNSVVVNHPVPDANGNWTYSIDLVRGANTISVKATDATGNNQTLVFALVYEVVTLDQVLPTTALADQTLRGTLATGASLTATIAPDPVDPVTPVTPVALTPVISGNTWSLDLIGVVEGSYTLTLTGTDDKPQETILTPKLVINPSRNLVTVDPVVPVTTDSITISGTVGDITTLTVTPSSVVKVGAITPGVTPNSWTCTLSDLVPGRNQVDIVSGTGDTQGTAQLVVLYLYTPPTL